MRILATLLLLAAAAGAQSKPAMQHATGTFEVKITPASTVNADANVTLSRNTLDKTFEGALRGISKGEMLAALTQTKGSAGYVAIEHVTAALEGRQGGFALQHSGTMSHGSQSLSITVVPIRDPGNLRVSRGRCRSGSKAASTTTTLPIRSRRGRLF